ncbi:glycosyltransferase family 2 protein [Amycolatopsis carbonis]|uniref:Glycosyltransferase family 2 protein n=1 Tax=Amycolatopsis carbonis TaxID=715471 RepID=A0A9Y2ICX7_9PSEU|nr:glycosyltransferase family 2 protein [Amycolatopsis sp. 2-15]WIX76686.1 glycosyltransferase family 2 protein [Amycolatopsis sp. 2-15]
MAFSGEDRERAPATSVVVCAYTTARWHTIRAALASAAGQTPAPLEVLLVVDHNPELARRARAELPGIRILDNEGPRGLSGARNTGIDHSVGDVIAFLDDDAAALPGWLAHLLAPYADPDVVAVGGAARPQWPTGSGRPAWLPATGVLDWVAGCTYTGLPTALAEVRNVMGCTMSFRRTVFDAIGGFSTRVGRVGTLPLGCEETELCIRAHRQLPRARILFEPRATVTHQVSVDRLTWSYLRRRSWSEGVSKAAVSRLAGTGPALAVERRYVARVLPAAVGHELVQAARGRPANASKAIIAIATALLATAGGYLRESARRRSSSVPSAAEPAVTAPATAVTELDIRHGPEALPVPANPGIVYRDAQVLVRDGRWALDLLRLPVTGTRVNSEDLRLAAPPTRPEPGSWTPKVSVVVPTADRADKVRRCVKSLLATDYPDLEVLLVDNRPHAAAAAALVELASGDPRTRYLAEAEPGVSRARNTGLAEACGPLVAFVDDDIEVDRWWLANLVAELADETVDCATSLVLPTSLDTPAQRKFEQLKGFGRGVRRQVFGPDLSGGGSQNPFTPGQFGPGGCALWRRSTLAGLGGFDPLLGPGTPTRAGEDLELFLRLARAGGSIVYTPHAVAWHEHSAEWAELRDHLHAYSIGLSAMFVRHLLHRPGDAGAIAAVVPSRVRRILLARSSPRDDGSAGPGARLLLEQLTGLAWGPAALARSAWRARCRWSRCP